MEKLELWRLRLEERKESGQTITEWCAEQGIKVSTFRYWSQKIKKYENPEKKFYYLIFPHESHR